MIRVSNIKVDILEDNIETVFIKIYKRLRIDQEHVKGYKILKKSLDARDKKNIFYVYEILLDVDNEEEILEKKLKDVGYSDSLKYKYEVTGENLIKERVVIVGSGPAGLFSAYFLAKEGYRPLIIERGKKVEERVCDVEEFFKTGVLNPNSNVCYGEGGAGAFSDGKLNTTIKDKNNRIREILNIFYNCGADKEVTYLNKAHIGTDVLRNVIINLRNEIIKFGGEFLYNTLLTDIIVEDNMIKAIEVNNKDIINCDVLVLAIGHSARDTYKMLHKRNVLMESKSFAVGVRVIHSQEMIDKNQYGKLHKYLKSADYKLTNQTKDRGVYSFCMCPGGYVVNSSTDKDMLVINGMSNHNRDSNYANSAIIVTVSHKDFGEGLFDGVKFQEKLEREAYKIAGGKIPIQKYGDYKDNKTSKDFGRIKPEFMGQYEFRNVRNILPFYINDAIIESMDIFAKKIRDFNDSDTIIAGVESRTSSPIRIKRDNMGVSNIIGIYPCGEGAGYAGGITSAALDGIKTFENIVKVYKKPL